MYVAKAGTNLRYRFYLCFLHRLGFHWINSFDPLYLIKNSSWCQHDITFSFVSYRDGYSWPISFLRDNNIFPYFQAVHLSWAFVGDEESILLTRENRGSHTAFNYFCQPGGMIHFWHPSLTVLSLHSGSLVCINVVSISTLLLLRESSTHGLYCGLGWLFKPLF